MVASAAKFAFGPAGSPRFGIRGCGLALNKVTSSEGRRETAAASGRPVRSPGDRRSHLRYAVVGRLWGSLEVLEALPIADLSSRGACVTSPHPMTQETTHSARLVLDRQVYDLHIRVRHSQELTSTSGTGSVESRVGLEFIGLSPSGGAEIDRYLES